jgi:hypothetical protein
VDRHVVAAVLGGLGGRRLGARRRAPEDAGDASPRAVHVSLPFVAWDVDP